MARRRYYSRNSGGGAGKIVAGVLTLVVVGGLVGGAIYHKDDIKSFLTPETENGEAWGDFVSQFNWQNAPSVSVGLDVSGKTPALTFTGKANNETAEEVFSSDNYSYGMLVAPLSDFEAVNTKKVYEFDWKTAFDKSKIDPVIDVTFDEDSEYVSIGDTQTTFGVSIPIEYGDHNTKYASVMYKKEVNEEGDVRYLYGSANIRINGASALYYATQALAYANGCDDDVGLVRYTEAELKAFNKIVNDAVDFANGLETPTQDNSQLTFTTNLPKTGVLELKQFTEEEIISGKEFFKIEVTVEHDLDVFVWFKDSESDVFYVYSDGAIDQSVVAGTLAMVYVGGQYAECPVSITAVQE